MLIWCYQDYTRLLAAIRVGVAHPSPKPKPTNTVDCHLNTLDIWKEASYQPGLLCYRGRYTRQYRIVTLTSLSTPLDIAVLLHLSIGSCINFFDPACCFEAISSFWSNSATKYRDREGGERERERKGEERKGGGGGRQREKRLIGRRRRYKFVKDT